MRRIGVFTCHCGLNIAGRVTSMKDLVDAAAKMPEVVTAQDYVYMCSDPGQAMLEEQIKKHGLDGVVVACCSPNLHLNTFRIAARSAGMNPYLLNVANIREQCTWVHSDPVKATQKAIKIIRSTVERVRGSIELNPLKIPVTRRALVIGAGIAGIQAALDISQGGYEVVLVERNPSIGGHMAQLSETFPTLDCSQCIMTPKMVEVARNKNIKLYNNAEVCELTGFVGNFKAKIKQKPQYVDPSKCTSCGECSAVCPVVVPNEFDMGLSSRKAIYIPFPQAVPSTYTLDEDACLGLVPLICGKCKEVCTPQAISYDLEQEIVEEEVGAVVLATGFDLYPMEELGEYGYGQFPDVIDGLYLERMLSASGPTHGEVRRPSDHTVPKEVVFIQCAGSREPDRHKPYCSKICCMYTTKHAMLYKHRVPDGQPYVFYIDIRAAGKDYEEFYQRAIEEDGVQYFRGKVGKVYEENGRLMVHGTDTLTGRKVEIAADMVVLAMAAEPSKETERLLQMLKIGSGSSGFVQEAHPKLRPVESITQGFFLAGCAQGPKDIPESVAQASGAASKVLALFAQEELFHDPEIAYVDEDLCIGCRICVGVCPYSARVFDEEAGVARVQDVLCEGCGACIVSCPSGATSQYNTTDAQVASMIKVAMGEADV